MHRPSHSRAMFADLVENGGTKEEFFDRDKQAQFEDMNPDEQLRLVSGQLWTCTDVMPSALCAELEMPSGSTYAQAARLIRQR